MRNFKLTIEYDGTDFHGWQIQPEVRTVQGVLEEALRSVLRDSTQVAGCCRTDAGVHALGFVGSFQSEGRLEPGQIQSALAAKLPDDIVVRDTVSVPSTFHARHSCVARRYVYRIATEKTAVHRRSTAYSKYDLDVARMTEGARAIAGEHDFTSFAPASLDNEISPVCTVLDASLRREENVILIDIKANRFLHHMVRNIAGTLIEVGRGRYDPEQVGTILCKKDRRAAGPTAPACGLVLVQAYYDGRDCP
jgi:tRNA pseudouridine38-40 synthase